MRLIFIVLTIVFIVCLYTFLSYNKNITIQKHLEKETSQYSMIYNTLFKEFQSKSQLIFDLMIDKKQVTDIYKRLNLISPTTKIHSCDQNLINLRDKLYEKLQNKYSKIKTNSKIPIIHFHTKNNLSFLSMEDFNNCCYDLTPFRPLLVNVNNMKQPISGFEIGHNSSMYRFLFPILDNGIHLGSVEISYDSLIFINELMGHSKALAQIHVFKKIVDKRSSLKEEIELHYKSSPLQGMYTINKHILNIENQSKQKHANLMTSKKAREKIETRLASKNKPFSIYDDINGYSITVLPIINPASKQIEGYFTIKSLSKYIHKEELSFYNHLFTIGFFIILIMILTYKYFSGEIKRSKLILEKNQALAKKQSELENINTNLEEIVTEKINENLKQKEFITKQSKIAALGEMLDAIAHQWKQPLNIINLTISNLVLRADLNETISKKEIIDLGESTQLQIEHLTTTIDEFRKFFRPDQPTNKYKVIDLINSTLKLQKNHLIQYHIDVQINIHETLQLNCIKTEFIHVLINIINNSIDAFNDNKIQNRMIKINAYKTDTDVAIEICDNAGGIPTDILPHIFKSNYTTKDTGKGTGIGLYLAKQIIEKIDGSIEAYNKETGVCFKILLKKENPVLES